MADNTKQNTINISDQEFQAIARFFMQGSTNIRPEETIDLFNIAEAAVLAIAERVVTGALSDAGVSLVMEPSADHKQQGFYQSNIIQLDKPKKW